MVKKEWLFSYGTLQLESVQKSSFGRVLNGTPDHLCGYSIEQLKIEDKQVLEKSEQQFHPIAIPSEDPNAQVSGVLFEVTQEELQEVDKYEVSDYKRIKATFNSGKSGWIYVKK